MESRRTGRKERVPGSEVLQGSYIFLIRGEVGAKGKGGGGAGGLEGGGARKGFGRKCLLPRERFKPGARLEFHVGYNMASGIKSIQIIVCGP